MKSLYTLLLTVALLLGGVAGVSATSEESYEPDQYRTINHGKSPDGRHTIATHEDMSDPTSLHLYLMDAKTGKKIGVLEEANDMFESASYAYDAKWSADSHQVAITYRVERHKTRTVRYRVDKGRAYFIKDPA